MAPPVMALLPLRLVPYAISRLAPGLPYTAPPLEPAKHLYRLTDAHRCTTPHEDGFGEVMPVWQVQSKLLGWLLLRVLLQEIFSPREQGSSSLHV